VRDELVHKWVHELPGNPTSVIISLLGRKHGPEGDSEFSFYSFHGAWDTEVERRGRPSFQEWLQRWHNGMQVVERPTYDFRPVAPETKGAVASDTSRYLSEGRTVVLVDSGGASRVEQVCKYMGYVEDSRATHSLL